jgi:hypothetical protein
MGILQEFLPLMYSVRGDLLGGIVGARPYTIFVVNEIKTSTGKFTSRLNSASTTTQIIESGGYSPKVKIADQEDFLRGAPQDCELVVGPITPKFGIGGTEYTTLEPTSGSTHYLVSGPGLDSVKFIKIGFVGDSVLEYYLYLKRAS